MMMRIPALRELVHELVDLVLGADVDAAGRVVQDEDPRLGHQPLGDDDLLLVAAREGLDRDVDRGRLDGEALGELEGLGELGVAVDAHEAGEAVEVGQGDVLEDGLDEHQALALAVLGHQADAVGHGVARAVDRDLLAVEADRAGGDVAVLAEDRGDELGAAGAHEARRCRGSRPCAGRSRRP